MDRDAALKTSQVAGAVAQSKTARNLIVGLIVLCMVAGAGHFVIDAMTAAQMLGARIQVPDTGATSLSCEVPLAAAGAGTNVTVSNLTAAQIERSHVVWQVAHELGFGDEGAVVGDITLAQESTRGADPKTHRPDSNVDVGPFQQRALPGWYASGKTVAENTAILMDIRYAAKTFFLGYKVTKADHEAARANGTQPAGPVGYTTPGLAQVKNWRTMEPTEAAQAVQRSAFPSAYAKHVPTARELIARFNAEAAPPAAVASAGETVNPALCDPPGAAPGDVASCPDSGLAAEKGLTPDATRVLRCAYQQWPKQTYGGVREDTQPYHPSGRAVDIMVPGVCAPLGQEIADWARANAALLGVVDVIWCQKIWSVARSSEGWRAMGDRGSNTANHGDHVHITVDGNSAGINAVPMSAAPDGQGGSSTRLPVDDYRLTARFGQCGAAWARCHTGLDFAGKAGQPVRAIRVGTVRAVEWNSAYGNLTKIDHGGGLESWYAHQQDTTVKAGAKVAAGQQVGTVGWTGNVKPAGPAGAHLHLEVRQGGSPTDPHKFLTAAGLSLAA